MTLSKFFFISILILLCFGIVSANPIISDNPSWDWMYEKTHFNLYFLEQPNQTNLTYLVKINDLSEFTFSFFEIKNLPQFLFRNGTFEEDQVIYPLYDSSEIFYEISNFGVKQLIIINESDLNQPMVNNLPLQNDVVLKSKLNPTNNLEIWLNKDTKWNGNNRSVDSFMLKDNKGNIILSFPLLEAYDSNSTIKNLVQLNYNLHQNQHETFLEIVIPKELFNQGVYPIYIDPSWSAPVCTGGTSTIPNDENDTWTETTTNWTISPGVSIGQSSIHKIGNYSIQITAGNYNTTETLDFGSINVSSSSYISFWSRTVAKSGNIYYLRFLTNSSNYFEITNPSFYDYFVWNYQSFSKSAFTTVGNPTWDNITKMEIMEYGNSPYHRWLIDGLGFYGNYLNCDDILTQDDCVQGGCMWVTDEAKTYTNVDYGVDKYINGDYVSVMAISQDVGYKNETSNVISYVGLYPKPYDPTLDGDINAPSASPIYVSAGNYKTMLYKVVIKYLNGNTITLEGAKDITSISNSPIHTNFVGDILEYDTVNSINLNINDIAFSKAYFKIPKNWTDNINEVDIYQLKDVTSTWKKITWSLEAEDNDYWYLISHIQEPELGYFTAIKTDKLYINFLILSIIGMGLTILGFTIARKRRWIR